MGGDDSAQLQVTVSEAGRGPLAHLRVVDFTTFLSGPHCTQILGDLGAEVIKVESPEGDLTRKLPPYFVDDDSAYFLSTNRNKRSIVIDLKTPDGQQVAARLAARADVVIENFRPGVASRLGLDYAAVAEQRPALVWCSITGFGQDGPYSDLAAYDMILQAMSGVMSLTGEAGRPGVRAGVPLSDLVGGMYAAIGILAAQQHAERTGRGQQIDISLFDSVTSMLSYQGAYHLISGVVAGRQGRGHDSIATYRTFTAKDGEDVTVTANTERMWHGLCAAVGLPELASEPRFASLDLRHENRHELWEILEDRFATRAAREWVEVLRAADVPAAVVNTVDRTLTDPQLVHRDMIVTVGRDDGTEVRLLGNPIKLSRSNQTVHRYPPRLGEDTIAVLSDVLDIPHAEIERLVAAGAVIQSGDGAMGGS